MQNKTIRKSSYQFAFPVVLFILLAVAMFAMTLYGAISYQKNAASQKKNFARETITDYIAKKISHNDARGSVSIQSLGDGDALYLSDSAESGEYVTILYTYHGTLREIYTKPENTFSLDAGSSICEAKSLELKKISDHLIQCTVTSKDGKQSIYVKVQSGVTAHE